MKILLVNKYYYLKGGDCTYLLELEKLLLRKGHSVAVFAMQHPNNYPSKFSEYFPSEVDFNQGGMLNSIKAVSRPIFSKEVKEKFNKLLIDFEPDVVHLNNIHSQLSPIIAQIAYSRKIPVIWTQHDYKALCPAYICVRNNMPCELCFTNKFNVVKHKCIKGSLPASILAYIESKVWNRKRLEEYTTQFICPSKFIQQKMKEGGFDSSKITNLPNFINLGSIPESLSGRKNYYCYVGRLAVEKGLDTLLQTSINFPDTDLIIIGTGPQEDYLKSKYKAEHIRFVGYKKWPEIENYLKSAKFMVVPSEWYENYPISIIESLSLGTPVLGSDAGGIPEMIDEGKSGLTFKERNVVDLADKLTKMLGIEFKYSDIQKTALNKYSSEAHYDNILSIYDAAMDKNRF